MQEHIHRHLRRAGVVAAASILTLGVLPATLTAADVTIEQIAPKESVVVISVPDVNESRVRLKRTPLWTLWKTEEVQGFYRDLFTEEMGTEIEAFEEEFGMKPSEIPTPQGAAGAAVFLEMDEELGQPMSAFVAFADYGSEADRAEELLGKILQKWENEQGFTYDDREIRGRTVYTHEIKRMEEVEEDQWAGGGGMPDPDQLVEQIEKVHWCRDDTRFFVSSSMVALEDALEVVDGEEGFESVSGNADYLAARKQVGTADATAVLMTAGLQPVLGPMIGGPFMMVQPVISQLFGDIRAYSFGMVIDGDVGMAEQVAAIYVPEEKVGLVKMLTTQTPRGKLPAFVGIDTIGYGRMNVEFGQLMPLVNEVVRGLPPMMKEDLEPQLQMMGPMLEEAFAHLGPEVHVMTTLAEPVTMESQAQAVVIRCTKTEAVQPLLDMLAPQSGMTPRDFLGNTIYSDEAVPAAIGIGGGWLVLGGTELVEQVLRTVGQANMAGLADEGLFRYAMSAMRTNEVVGWGFTNVIANYAYQVESGKEMMKMIEEMNREMGVEGDVDVEQQLGMMARFFDTVTPSFLSKYIGPATWDLVADDSGFVTRFYYLPPEPPKN